MSAAGDVAVVVPPLKGNFVVGDFRYYYEADVDVHCSGEMSNSLLRLLQGICFAVERLEPTALVFSSWRG